MESATDRWLELAEGIASLPTAPTFEEVPLSFVKQFASSRPHLRIQEDGVGNLLVKLQGKSAARRPPLVLVAHLDHPGFEVSRISGASVTARFRGGMRRQHIKRGAAVRFFERTVARSVGRGEIAGVEAEGERLRGATIRLTSGTAAKDGFAMWDLTPFSKRGDKIYSRVCDDLMGAAAILCVLDELGRGPHEDWKVWGLFTRAEEIGFLGAVEAIRGKYIPKNAVVISLECSRALPQAPQGEGVIVRVGDLSSIFDPGLSEAVRASAVKLSERDGSFKFRRALMDGGSCEATPFCDEGYRASGLAIPLENYHNQAVDGGGKPGIGAEYVNVSDFFNEVDLLLELARGPDLLTPRRGRSERMKRLFQTARKELRPIATERG